jgi:hypothetical protein
MARPLRLLFVNVSLVFSISFMLEPSTAAQTIWSGLTKSFTKTIGSDPSLPQNQDSLTANVILTRGPSGGGLYNIAIEGFYSMNISPALTSWATDVNNPGKTITATNWQNLAFTDWIDAYGGSHTAGGSIAGRNAVVRLTSDNVYLDLRFTNWDAGGGGGYTYLRAEPPASSPTGDYNGNGVVDAADYVAWRQTLGRTGVQAGSGADGNANGEIDSGDYTYWQQRFGNTISGFASGQIATVPEPSVEYILVYGLGLFRTARKLRQRRT